MGQVWSGGPGLTQYEVEELVDLSKGCFTQEDIESLYRRFRTLDRNRKGYLLGNELLDIPELSINPLNKRIAYFCDGINFKEFVRILAPYSRRASREDTLRALFGVWDVNGDGCVCHEDVELLIRQAGGGHLREEEVQRVVDRVMEECWKKNYDDNTKKKEKRTREEGWAMSFQEFCVALGETHVDLCVDIPPIH